jgi:hypothetical protein
MAKRDHQAARHCHRPREEHDDLGCVTMVILLVTLTSDVDVVVQKGGLFPRSDDIAALRSRRSARGRKPAPRAISRMDNRPAISPQSARERAHAP